MIDGWIYKRKSHLTKVHNCGIRPRCTLPTLHNLLLISPTPSSFPLSPGYAYIPRDRKVHYKPPDPDALMRARATRIKELKMFDILREIVFYAFFLWILLVITYVGRWILYSLLYTYIYLMYRTILWKVWSLDRRYLGTVFILSA